MDLSNVIPVTLPIYAQRFVTFSRSPGKLQTKKKSTKNNASPIVSRVS